MPATAADLYAALGTTQTAVVTAEVDLAEKQMALATSEAGLVSATRQAKIAKAVAVATFTARPYYADGFIITVDANGELVSTVPYQPTDEVAPVSVDIDGDGEADNV